MSIPLMLGVSLVTADDWILRHYAAKGIGDIARLNFAKRLFAVPIAILGQAAGQASLPFFSRLFEEKKFEEFAATVNASVYRITAASLLMTGWMMAIALPLIDLVYRRGVFTFADSESTAVYFFWFSLSLGLWSSQALYARAFYASGNTLTPMIATSLITVASLPMYALLFRTFSSPDWPSPPTWALPQTPWPSHCCCIFAAWFVRRHEVERVGQGGTRRRWFLAD
jgi:putative peptidoglycan lipid II flippase